MTYLVKRQNKYYAQTAEYNGISYHSKKEGAFARELDLRQKAGDIKKWDRQIKIDLKAYGEHICNYYVDFVVINRDGSKEYIEVKGFETEVWRLKWKIFEAQMKNKKNIKLTIIK